MDIIFGNAIDWLFQPITAAYALAAIGIALHFGFTGLLNFGQAVFMAVGAYGFSISIKFFGLGFWPAVAVAIIFAKPISGAISSLIPQTAAGPGWMKGSPLFLATAMVLTFADI